MISCHSHVYIYFPSIGKVFETDLDFHEKIGELLARLLNEVEIADSTFYNLYGCNKNLKKISSKQKCSVLFASEFESFVILPSDLVKINLYFDNSQYSISYSKDTPASSLISSFASSYLIPISTVYYVLFDPSTNSIISMQKGITSDLLILKNFYSILPGVIFDFLEFNQTSNSSLLINSPLLLAKQMRTLINSIIINKGHPFQIQALTQDQISKHLDFYKAEDGINSLSQTERNTLFFMLISGYNDPFITDRLHQIVLTASGQKSDIIRFEMAIIFVYYLPLSSHIILIQLVNIFGGAYTNVENHKFIISLIHEVMFKKSLDKDLELKFIEFLFLFGNKILYRTPVTGDTTSARLYQNDQLVLFDINNKAFSINGPVNVDINATTEFTFNRPLKELLDKYLFVQKKEEDVQNLLKTDFIDNCISSYGKINQRLISKCPKGILYPFWEYLSNADSEDLEILV